MINRRLVIGGLLAFSSVSSVKASPRLLNEATVNDAGHSNASVVLSADQSSEIGSFQESSPFLIAQSTENTATLPAGSLIRVSPVETDVIRVKQSGQNSLTFVVTEDVKDDRGQVILPEGTELLGNIEWKKKQAKIVVEKIKSPQRLYPLEARGVNGLEVSSVRKSEFEGRGSNARLSDIGRTASRTARRAGSRRAGDVVDTVTSIGSLFGSGPKQVKVVEVVEGESYLLEVESDASLAFVRTTPIKESLAEKSQLTLTMKTGFGELMSLNDPDISFLCKDKGGIISSSGYICLQNTNLPVHVPESLGQRGKLKTSSLYRYDDENFRVFQTIAYELKPNNESIRYVTVVYSAVNLNEIPFIRVLTKENGERILDESYNPRMTTLHRSAFYQESYTDLINLEKILAE